MNRKLSKQSRLVRIVPALSLALIILAWWWSAVAAGQPDEPAYFNGKTVTINAIEVPQHAPLQAQADLYLVVYNWLGSAGRCAAAVQPMRPR
jgi:hypothetical protein